MSECRIDELQQYESIVSIIVDLQKNEAEQLKQIEDTLKFDPGDNYADYCHSHTFYSIGTSFVIASTLTTFIESLFVNKTNIIKGLIQKKLTPNKNVRWKYQRSNKNHFWDPHRFATKSDFKKDSKKIVKTDFKRGCTQLVFKALEYETTFEDPIKIQKTIETLWTYRNFMVHNGFEWPPHKKEAFQDLIDNKRIDDQFETSFIDKSIWKYYLKDSFVNECFEVCEKLIIGFDDIISIEKTGKISDAYRVFLM